MFEAVATPCTVFRCVALESPNTVFKFPSLELSRALTCAVETSELPVARGAGGSWVWQLLLMQCLLAVPTTSTLHTVSAGAAMLRSNFFLSVMGGTLRHDALPHCIQQQPNTRLFVFAVKVRPYSTQTPSSYWIIITEIRWCIWVKFPCLSYTVCALFPPGAGAS